MRSQYLENVVPDKKRIARVALRPSSRCLSHIIKLRAGEKIGIVGYSVRFAELIYNTCEMYAEDVILSNPLIVGDGVCLEKYLKGKDMILVPKKLRKIL